MNREVFTNLFKKFKGSGKESAESLQDAGSSGKASSFFRFKLLRPALFLLAITGGVAASGFGVMAVIAASYSYDLNAKVQYSMAVVPEEASMYVEVKNLKQFKNTWKQSKLGEKISESSAWNNFLAGDSFLQAGSLIYFLQVKSGFLANFTELSSFFDSSIGYATFQGGKWLGVARTNLKSKFGMALVASFKSDSVEISTPKKSSGGSSSGNKSAPVYVEAFPEKVISVSNLKVSHVKFAGDDIYFILLNDLLLAANDLDVLKSSLKLTSKSSSGSLGSRKGFKKVKKEFVQKDVQAFLYLNNKTSPVAPFLKVVHPSEGTVFTLKAPSGEPISANIYTINRAKGKKRSQKRGAKPAHWENNIPLNASVAFLSRRDNISHVYSSWKNLGKNFKSLQTGSRQFFKAAGIDPGKAYTAPGFAVSLHDFRSVRKKLVPDFSLAFGAEKLDSSLAEALFQTGSQKKASFQKRTYYRLDHSGRRYYSPSYSHFNKRQFQASSRTVIEDYIAASKGNRPALADSGTFDLLGDYKKAPYHLVINMPAFLENLKAFYNYGAEKSPDYSEKTIRRDILPLLEPFGVFEAVHLATGLESNPVGYVVFLE